MHRLIAPRDQKYQSNFVEVQYPLLPSPFSPSLIALTDRPTSSNVSQYRNHKIVYRRYAGLFFSMCVDANDNELAWLESIHLFVEVLGKSLVPSLSEEPSFTTIQKESE